MSSETLNRIMHQWHEELPSEGEIALPFDIETFCQDNDRILVELRAENERLREKLANYETLYGDLSHMQDAERYRLIRRNVTPAQLVANGLRDGGDLAPSETIGARIDWMVEEAIAARGNDD